jgi:hypothetical protein
MKKKSDFLLTPATPCIVCQSIHAARIDPVVRKQPPSDQSRLPSVRGQIRSSAVGPPRPPAHADANRIQEARRFNGHIPNAGDFS